MKRALRTSYGECGGYTSKQMCRKGMDSVKMNAPDDANYERKTSTHGEFYFVLLAANGEKIAKSETYTTTAMCEKGIEVVKREAPGAEVEE